MKKFSVISYFLVIFSLVSSIQAYDEPLPSENEISNEEDAAAKKEADIKAQEIEQEKEEQEKEDALKAKEASGDLSPEDLANQIAQLQNQTNQEIGALQQQDSAVQEEITVLKNEANEISQAEAAAQAGQNAAAIKQEAQLAVTIKLSDISSNLKLFAPELTIGYSSDQCSSVVITCSNFIDSLTAMDQSQLTSDQVTKIAQLKLQSEAIINAVHANILHNIDLVIDVSNTLKPADALSAIVKEITSAYGLDIPLSSNATAEEQAFNREGQDLLLIFNNVSSAADYAQKLLTFKKQVYDISTALLRNIESLNVELENTSATDDEYYGPNKTGGDVIDDINKGLFAGSDDLNGLIDKYGQDLAGNSFGQFPMAVSVILSKVQLSLNSGDYDTVKVGLAAARDNVNVSLNYLDGAYELLANKKAAFDNLSTKRALTKNELSNLADLEGSLANLAKNISEVSLARAKIDALSFVSNSGVKQLIDSYNKDVGVAVKSTATTIFGSLGDKLSSFFTKIKSAFVFKKADAILSDQITQIIAGANAMQSDMATYVDRVNTMIQTAENFDTYSPLPDFSRDRTPSAKLTDPNYRRLGYQVQEVQSMLDTLQAEVSELNYRNGTVASIGDAVWGVYQMMGASGFIVNECPSLIVNGKIDSTAIVSLFKIPQSPTLDQIISLGNAQLIGINGPGITYTQDQMIAAGNDVLGRLKIAKQVTDLSVNDMLCLVKMYEDQYNNPNRVIQPSDDNNRKSARNIYYLLKGSGVLGWEQLKSLIAGKQDYQQIAQNTDATNYANTIGQIFNIKQTIDGMKISLIPTAAYLQSSISNLTVWLDSANQVLGKQSSDDFGDDSFVMVPSAAEINADNDFLNSVGMPPLGGDVTFVESMPPLQTK